ncbi:MAG: radical SAM protein, partial [Candidatus Omnitrophica bacterium]|nr:radical SAM protein [Candidatus Omnitrophota bacterium]
ISHITLLGQNVNSYSFLEAEKCGIKRGNTQNNISVAGKYSRAVNFVGLLEKVSEIEGVKKIDFVTSHPKDAGVKLFKAIARIPKINQYLHLPMQSGSNKILKLMKRGYTVEKYRKLVDSYRKIVPGGKLSTDIIVGFPGETEDDFKMTLEAVKEIKFDNAYIFKYSPRPPAESSKMVDDVPKEVKEQRHGELLEMQKRMYLERK